MVENYLNPLQEAATLKQGGEEHSIQENWSHVEELCKPKLFLKQKQKNCKEEIFTEHLCASCCRGNLCQSNPSSILRKVTSTHFFLCAAISTQLSLTRILMSDILLQVSLIFEGILQHISPPAASASVTGEGKHNLSPVKEQNVQYFDFLKELDLPRTPMCAPTNPSTN